MSTILEVQGLTKKYKNLTAVNNLSFKVEQGDIYGFLGQNGAGKSTTIRMMLSLIKPTSGEIEIFGKSLYANKKEILSQIGAIIEKPDMYKFLSAYDNLRIFSKMSRIKADRKKIMEQLEVVGLANRSKSKVKTFSQGMKQRLGIAIALIHNPSLIILDEPTNGLDPQGIADIRNLILSLSKEMNKTVIVSSHLLSEIELIANRMIVIDKGKKIVEGTVKELLDPAKTSVTLDTTNSELALEKLKSSPWSESLTKKAHQIVLQLNKADIPSMVVFLTESGIGINAIQPRHSLEAYFLSLTNNESYVESSAD
ncbi:MAG: ABC transporter ATP-binding protein [Ferruginibacter sp.]|nr:ABC transporter ATP-binding protein [Ferruginibacter sp.]